MTKAQSTSAQVVDNQIHSLPNKYGIENIIIIWNTNILKNEIVADTTQLFNPVKNADQNILIHCTIYQIAYNLIALVVNANNSAS